MAKKTEKKSPEQPENESNNKEPEKIDSPQLFQPNLKPREISEEMETSYIDYAMSVIVARALPDVRDGLKPVHRRILYAASELGLKASAKYLKSARVVGDVVGKYHHHGDTAVYDSLVRMAQDFSLRYPLIKGQGNFGSIDGDSAAAMRYTEAKMTALAEEMLADIDKATVAWNDNYDGTRQEPSVLPTKIPQLLLNGTMGIAVGMATNIPPHNLGEVVDGIIELANNPEASIDDLMKHIKGPDFPTAGIIYDKEAIKAMYVNGRGGVVLRGKAEIIEKDNKKTAIVISEIPYQVNKSVLVEKIAELATDKKIKGISDLRDESNREGIRIMIELKKEAYPKKLLNQLYKFTDLQTNFNMNMIALVDGLQPRLLNLKSVLEYFIAHRQEVITKRTQFELKVAEARAHILEGLTIALDDIDAVIATIKKSPTKEEAHAALMKKFKLSEKQATAILEMRLQTLAGLERKKIQDEYKAILELIKELQSILKDAKKILNLMKKELLEIKAKYADLRRTQIVPHPLGEFSTKDTIPNEPMIVILSKENYIKRLPQGSFRAQNRGGKGIVGGAPKDADEIKSIMYAKNHDEMMFFSNLGRLFRLPVHEIPQAARNAKGQAIVNLLQLGRNEEITAWLSLKDEKFACKYLLMCTKKGTIKKTVVEDFQRARKSGLIAIKLRPEDSLEWVREVNDNDEVMIVTRHGKCIRFNEKDARAMGRASTGVRGIRLKENDQVVEMDIVRHENADLFVIMENGIGKCSPISLYRFQSRGGSGIKTANVNDRTGEVVAARVVASGDCGDLMVVSRQGQIIRLNLKDIPSRGRATQGVYLMRLNEPDRVASISVIDDQGQGEGEQNVTAEEQKTLV